jgi:SRSO17 transposase
VIELMVFSGKHSAARDHSSRKMGDYEVRTWRGWHHHMPLVILAHFFLVRMDRRLKKTPRG